MTRPAVQPLNTGTRPSAWPMVARCMWRQWLGLPQETRVKIVDCIAKSQDGFDYSSAIVIMRNRVQASDLKNANRYTWVDYDQTVPRMGGMSAPLMCIKEELWTPRRLHPRLSR